MIIGLGTDLLDIRRLQKAIDEHGKRFLDKLFTENEQCYCSRRRATPHYTYGTTFAAKEAALKAISNTKGIGWHDIEVVRLPSGKPTIKLYNKAHENCLALTHPYGYVLHLSLTDEPPYAHACVIIERGDNEYT